VTRKIINVGSANLAGDGEPIRDALIKVNNNFEDVYNNIEQFVIAEISKNTPNNPKSGDLWWNTTDGNLYIRYDDGVSEQWVTASTGLSNLSVSSPANVRTLTHDVDILAQNSSTDDGSEIAINNTFQTEKVILNNNLSNVGRATLPNVSIHGKTVILVTNTQYETVVDISVWNNSKKHVSIFNSDNGVAVLVSLGLNGWKLLT
jgi:hypothetical protein